jgi:hypothetical protein
MGAHRLSRRCSIGSLIVSTVLPGASPDCLWLLLLLLLLLCMPQC